MGIYAIQLCAAVGIAVGDEQQILHAGHGQGGHVRKGDANVAHDASVQLVEKGIFFASVVFGVHGEGVQGAVSA